MKWAYAKDPAFTESLRRAKERMAAWPEERRIAVESVRRFRREKSRIAHED